MILPDANLRRPLHCNGKGRGEGGGLEESDGATGEGFKCSRGGEDMKWRNLYGHSLSILETFHNIVSVDA